MRNPEVETVRKRQYQIPQLEQLQTALALFGFIPRAKRDENGKLVPAANGKGYELEVRKSENPTEDFIKWYNSRLATEAERNGDDPGAFFVTAESEEGREQLRVIHNRLNRMLRSEFRAYDGKIKSVESYKDDDNKTRFRFVDTKESANEGKIVELPMFPGLESRRGRPKAISFDLNEAALAELESAEAQTPMQELLSVDSIV